MAKRPHLSNDERLITYRYLPLLWVFDRLGKHLYAHEWTGNELFASPMESPDAIKAMQAPLKDVIARIDARIDDRRKEKQKTTDANRLSAIDNEIQSALNERSLAMAKLQEIPDLDDGNAKAFASYQRRNETEALLLTALRKGHIQAQCIDGLVLPNDLWEGTRGFKFYLNESLAVLPRTFSGKRRGLIVFNRNAFDKWLRGIRPQIIDIENSPSAETLCELELREVVGEGPKTKRKDEYFAEISERIQNLTGQELSKRAFEKVWGNVAPASWKKPGRPKDR